MTMINRAELLLLFVTTIVQSFLRYNLFGHALHLSAKRVEDPNDYDCLKMSKIIVELKLEETLFLSRKISKLAIYFVFIPSKTLHWFNLALTHFKLYYPPPGSLSHENIHAAITRNTDRKWMRREQRVRQPVLAPPATRSRFMYYRKQGSEYSPLSRCLCSKHRVFAVPSIKWQQKIPFHHLIRSANPRRRLHWLTAWPRSRR